ncbi:hypothetical protein TH61_04165 [Rufibacter sp. DG15C]|uniref:hypothetical protein n=1 Tax=Rufibacter sp. DG15C TaxID=1379909 RepID=UPI00078B668C|nr:hypothetical protein [Rufibacter sp. DG15C]AMM50529.1 hypothetical protein TH61_04165 [Rufibacter sp. DG15C]
MEPVKKFLNVLVMVYLVITFLFLLHILSVSKFVMLFDMADNASFYYSLLWVGALLLFTLLLVENAYIATLKRGLERERRQLTDAKAQLFDQRLKAASEAPIVPRGAKPESARDIEIEQNLRHGSSQPHQPTVHPNDPADDTWRPLPDHERPLP